MRTFFMTLMAILIGANIVMLILEGGWIAIMILIPCVLVWLYWYKSK